ncbi:MAG: adenylate/guanylate cyclase domain-containing protein, partial [Verrucomicrobiales bacterium]
MLEDEISLRHHLITPVLTILGYAEILLENIDASIRPEVAEHLSKIIEVSTRMHRQLDERIAATSGRESKSMISLLERCRDSIFEIAERCDRLNKESSWDETGQRKSDLQRIYAASEPFLVFVNEFICSDGESAILYGSARSQRTICAIVAQGDRVRLEQASQYSRSPLRRKLTGRILVVDDTEVNCDLMMRRLTAEGHEVSCAANGFEGLKLCREGGFDLVLLDLVMPEMRGDEMLTVIKSDPFLRAIPVIMVSATRQHEEVVVCLELGAEDYLSKPCNPVLLQVRVQGVLERKRLHDQERVILSELRMAREKSEALLYNILPGPIAERLKMGENPLVDEAREATVLFADLVGFSALFKLRSAGEIVTLLDEVFSFFDDLAAERGLEKIKTIGDAYMVVGGLPDPMPDHVAAIADLALAMQSGITSFSADLEIPVQLRIGVATGPVMAGVIGRNKFAYDVWGDPVNMASRMESHGQPGKIQVSEKVFHEISGRYRLQERGNYSPPPARQKGEISACT